ncbi:MAG: hypothetical protein L6R38_006495 [Xanthoria sp. 2 TBL-2021]|nr:MAG: hypothetical protein L6R38_006495 [Xanthoria sp. 2 TBL-2021]
MSGSPAIQDIHPSRRAYIEEASPDPVDFQDLPSVDLQNVETNQDPQSLAILSQLARKRRLAAVTVPTDDAKVRQFLRRLAEPMTLFGEGAPERRDRLRSLLLDQDEDDVMETVQDTAPQDNDEEEFYTAGSQALLLARQSIARYSLPRARSRLQSLKAESTIPLRTHIKHRAAIKSRLANFDLLATQIAGDRPVSLARFSPSGKIIAAGNWGGGVRLLDVPDLNELKTLRGHKDKIGGISWFPNATLATHNIPSSAINLATSGGEGDIHLWSLDQDTPISTLSGHTARVARIEFHPSGQYLASASSDTTWRLWDVPTTSELLLQEGHSREVYALSFNTDGSLLATAGLDSIGRIWDLRTGRTVMILDGHIREIYALDWSLDGHRVLSGSGDGWVKCWDVRKVAAVGAVGAHQRGVTDLRWYKGLDPINTAPPANGNAQTNGTTTTEIAPKKAGTFFVSGGFDKNVNIFSADDWSLARSLSGHSGNVLGVDVSSDAKYIASCGHDRTVKLWGSEDGEEI